ncbi:hypothetical protein [Plantibacter sp. YIM 135249]|uniref:hypothetical protein n=1 Tax=Plantibacter sp. YIM 135249 TaxID=3423918 RepID=UPI003D349FFA
MLVRTLAGGFGAVVYVFGVGYLSMQADAVSSGVILNGLFHLQAVTTAHAPWLQYLALSCWAGLAAYLLFRRSLASTRPATLVHAIAPAVILTICVAGSLATTTYPYEGPLASKASPVETLFREGALSPWTLSLGVALIVFAVVDMETRKQVASSSRNTA